jgi:hypothetical protein
LPSILGEYVGIVDASKEGFNLGRLVGKTTYLSVGDELATCNSPSEGGSPIIKEEFEFFSVDSGAFVRALIISPSTSLL